MSASIAREIGALDHLDFGTVLDGAARLRPERLALSGADIARLSFGAFDSRVTQLATQFSALQLPSQSRLVLCGGTSVTSVLVIYAGLRAGLDVALAPAHLDATALAIFARDVEAVAIAADMACPGARAEDEMLEIAASLPALRVICATGPMDGAVLLDAEAEGTVAFQPVRAADGLVIMHDPEGPPAYYNQRRLLAAALDLVTQASISLQQPVLSTLSPMGFAGLVAGPLAMLLTGAPLVLHAPFELREFTDELARLAPCHVVAPAALGPALLRERVVTAAHCASLILAKSGEDVMLPEEDRPLVLDLSWSGASGYVLQPREAPAQKLAVIGQRMRAVAMFNQA
ncbi:MAG: hypothetical protein JWL62_2153 [Hyphomicrobiales bacterium]|nr:hypothetical protein [Hyphomicrobiales bacterium]